MTNLPITVLATVILMAQIPGAFGQQAAAKDKLVGNWKLLSFFDETVDTGKTTNVLGDDRRGYLILTADGRIALTFVDGQRKPPQGQRPTDLEPPSCLEQCWLMSEDMKPNQRKLKLELR